ncbi:hypothetical protein ACIBCN_06465 [Nocardia sp. NPDC051052]|uniref:hypothetical protein n=1 Tax=Nocardia sp. NPDC051052 TaxID=3364322 RepID=UPI00379E1D07
MLSSPPQTSAISGLFSLLSEEFEHGWLVRKYQYFIFAGIVAFRLEEVAIEGVARLHSAVRGGLGNIIRQDSAEHQRTTSRAELRSPASKEAGGST